MDAPERYGWMRMIEILKSPDYTNCINIKGLTKLTEKTYEDLITCADINEIEASMQFEPRFYIAMREDVELYTRFSEELEHGWNDPVKLMYVLMLRQMVKDKKIPAIKTIRKIWSIGLKDSKEFCEKYMYGETKQILQIELDTILEEYPEYEI